MNEIKIKRVYEEVEAADGYRILVDRLWPRGIKKEELKFDYWAKEITPSTEIRKAFNHQEERFKEFMEKYIEELNQNEVADAFVDKVEDTLAEENVTLLYAAKDTRVNHVNVLKDWLTEKL